MIENENLLPKRAKGESSEGSGLKRSRSKEEPRTPKRNRIACLREPGTSPYKRLLCFHCEDVHVKRCEECTKPLCEYHAARWTNGKKNHDCQVIYVSKALCDFLNGVKSGPGPTAGEKEEEEAEAEAEAQDSNDEEGSNCEEEPRPTPKKRTLSKNLLNSINLSLMKKQRNKSERGEKIKSEE